MENVTSKWVNGNLVFYDAAGNVLLTFDGVNHKLVFDANIQALVAAMAVSAANVVGAAGANPTQAEYATVVTLTNANKAAINLILTALKAAGIIASA